MSGQVDPPPTSTFCRRSCWECSRRRLICDLTHPVCNRCRERDIACPGYEDTRQLKWLAPGRVTSRTRGKKKSRPGRLARSRSETTEGFSPTKSPDGGDSTGTSDDGNKDLYDGWFSEEAESGDDVAVAARRRMIMGLVPNTPLVSDASNIVQAAVYYNSVIYPEYEKRQLSPTPFVRHLPLEMISKASPAYNNILVSIVLRHHIYRLPSKPNIRDGTAELWCKSYHHRGLAIAALNEEIQKCDLARAGMLMVGVIAFIAAELQESGTPAWKYHVDALARVVSRSGGVKKMCQFQPWLKTIMILFILTLTTGCTTSPPLTFDAGRHELEEILEFVEEWWDKFPYPTFPCPADVLLIIIRVNYLRSTLLKPGANPITTPEDLLCRIRVFSPEAWAAAKPGRNEEWLAVATAHHSAAVIYCISSLERHFSPSSRQDLEVQRALYASRLFSSLHQLVASVGARWSGVWPLVVAGVEAAREGDAAREFVGARFVALAEDLATPMMLEAKSVFERFWASGNVRWDECFDRPYAFVL